MKVLKSIVLPIFYYSLPPQISGKNANFAAKLLITNEMKRLICAFVMTLTTAFTAWAAPAFGEWITITQADGTQLTVRQFGDEHHHWTETTDGTLVVNTGHGYYVAQIDQQGRLSASTVLAHEAPQRQAAEQALVSTQTQRRALFHERGQQAQRRSASLSVNGSYLPHAGTVRVLTILAAYSDLDFTVTDPVAAFNQYLNGDTQADLGNMNAMNRGSVRQYFEASSHGQFSPQFDVVGPITLPETLAYYGGTSDTGSDDKFSAFCRDAITKVSEQQLVDDWTVYDNDGDGTAELVCIIFAGYGQNQGGAANTIWAKASRQNMTVGEQKIAYFNCSSEKFHPQQGYENYINGTGVFIHELSHCMGLPDLYATVSSAVVNNQGMETYDIMDYGCYNRNGFAPSLYTAWEQEAMGWIELEPLTETQYVTDLLPLEQGGKAYKIPSPDNDLEYIVLENIQKSGLNTNAYGHGLLAYHVAYAFSTVNMSDYPNNTVGHPRVAVVPASGLFINNKLRKTNTHPERPHTSDEWKASMASAPFPGTQAVSELNDDQKLPNYCFYQSDSNGPVGHYLYNITEDEQTGTVSFYFDTKDAPVEPEEPIVMIPVDGKQRTDISLTDMANEDLTNNVVGGVYYNLGEGSGYDTDEQCITIGQTTDMSTITDSEPGSDDMKAHFNGLVLLLTEGSGTFAVKARTVGNMALAIQMGGDAPVVKTADEQSDIVIDYEVAAPTYVYVYAVEASTSEAPRRVLAENGIAIYGITVTPGASTGITNIVPTVSQSTVECYNLAGQRVSSGFNGIVVHGGKKVLIK